MTGDCHHQQGGEIVLEDLVGALHAALGLRSAHCPVGRVHNKQLAERLHDSGAELRAVVGVQPARHLGGDPDEPQLFSVGEEDRQRVERRDQYCMAVVVRRRPMGTAALSVRLILD